VSHLNRTLWLMFQIDYVFYIDSYLADDLFEMLKCFYKLFPRISVKWSQ